MRDDSAGGYHPVPGFTPPNTKRGRRAVAEILDAARGHLLDDGIERFSLREVARRADYSPAAIYNHFDGVETLVNLLALEGVQALGAYLEQAQRELPAPARLHELGVAYLDFSRAEPERYRLVFATLAAPQTTWDDYVATAYPFTLLIEACAQGLERAELVDLAGVGPSGLAYGLWSLVHGIAMLSAHHLGSIQEADASRLRIAALDAMISGITNPERERTSLQ